MATGHIDDTKDVVLKKPESQKQKFPSNTLSEKKPSTKSSNTPKPKKTEDGDEMPEFKTTNYIKNVVIQARNANNMKRKDVAQKVNVPEKTITELEKGTLLYKDAPLGKLENVLKVKLRGK
jgi:ribosome-binding protein aMBF1 (putative translation factor)